jgi:hypothetical protein
MMHEIFLLLDALSEQESHSFSKFLKSPYHNNRKILTNLFDQYVKFRTTGTSGEEIFRKIFASKKIGTSNGRVLLHRLLMAAKDFLAYERFKKRALERKLDLMKEYYSRDLKDLCSGEYDKATKNLKKEKLDSDYFFANFLLESERFNLNQLHAPKGTKKQVRTMLDVLTRRNAYLTSFFISELFCGFLNMMVLSKRYRIDFKKHPLYDLVTSTNFDAITEMMEKSDRQGFYPQIYRAMLDAFIDIEDIRKYYNYKKLVYRYAAFLSIEEIGFHFSKLIAYCMYHRSSASNGELFSRKLEGHYKIMLKERYYLDRKTNFLTVDLYRNILNFAAEERRASFVKQLAAFYSKQLPREHRENGSNLAFANYFHILRKFSSSLDYLKQISINYFAFKYDIRNLMLKNYYELGYIDAAESLVKTYKEFLTHNEMIERAKQEDYGKFVKYFHKLISFSNDKNRDAGLWKDKLDKEANFPDKKWLLEKFEKITGAY